MQADKPKSRRRFIIHAMAISPPGTMGGNTKIALEMARGLSDLYEVHFIVPDHKLATVTDSVAEISKFTIHPVPGFRRHELLHPIASSRHYLRETGKVFSELKVGKDDIVYSATDGHIDVVPLWLLHRRCRFTWVGSFFLFVPGVIDNLLHRYGFPVFIYAGLWCYQRILFALLKSRCVAFVITNSCDARHFPARLKNRLFAFYGGVNTEQIPSLVEARTREVVFCSRLSYQKGIWGFLDVWREVRRKCQTARLTIIGNGAPAYEAALRRKAARLGIADSIEWLGYVNNAAKFKIYAEAKVFVHPTVYDNNGMVAAEALCTGLPVVMFDLSNLREVYTDGCVKVPEGDGVAFAAAVVELLLDDVRREQAAPSAAQVDALRTHWRWSSRTAAFADWLGGVLGMEVDG